jgi:hypothetical protein
MVAVQHHTLCLQIVYTSPNKRVVLLQEIKMMLKELPLCTTFAIPRVQLIQTVQIIVRRESQLRGRVIQRLPSSSAPSNGTKLTKPVGGGKLVDTDYVVTYTTHVGYVWVHHVLIPQMQSVSTVVTKTRVRMCCLPVVKITMAIQVEQQRLYACLLLQERPVITDNADVSNVSGLQL